MMFLAERGREIEKQRDRQTERQRDKRENEESMLWINLLIYKKRLNNQNTTFLCN